MVKENTHVGSPPDEDDVDVRPAGPRPSMPVTTGIPQRRGTGQVSSGFGSGQPGRPPSSSGAGGPPRGPPSRPLPTSNRPPPSGGGGGRAQPRFFPPQPRSLQEAGISQTMGEELVLKALFFAGELRGADICNRIKLPQLIVDEIIEGLRKQKFVDLKGGVGLGVGKSSMIYTLTTFATDVLRQILDRNRYNGPAPVRLEDWFEAVAAQTVRGMRITKDRMKEKFGNQLVVKDSVFDGLGPAMNSGKAIFFYGPPGQRQDRALPGAGQLLRGRHLGAARAARRRLHHPRLRLEPAHPAAGRSERPGQRSTLGALPPPAGGRGR